MRLFRPDPAVASILLAIFACVLSFAPAGAAEDQYLVADYTSTLLSAFWNQPVVMRAHIVLPDSYYKQPDRRYPTIYVVPALDGTSDLGVPDELRWQKPMRANGVEFIIVVLEPNFKNVHTLFADSANNGPWDSAVSQEFVPFIDSKLRTIPDPADRFLEGHSSGGWAALWLQITQPGVFGGVWSVSPDPVDFRDFTGADLLSPQANMFHDATGKPYVMRGSGLYGGSMRDLLYRLPEQFRSDDAAYSPKGPDGKPETMFDWKTGAVDPAVIQYWEDHYDVASLLAKQWPRLSNSLRGKIHIFVGDQDTFHLEGSVHLLDAVLQKLGAGAEIVYVPRADHWTVFDYNGDLFGYMIGEMKQALPAGESSSGR